MPLEIKRSASRVWRILIVLTVLVWLATSLYFLGANDPQSFQRAGAIGAIGIALLFAASRDKLESYKTDLLNLHDRANSVEAEFNRKMHSAVLGLSRLVAYHSGVLLSLAASGRMNLPTIEEGQANDTIASSLKKLDDLRKQIDDMEAMLSGSDDAARSYLQNYQKTHALIESFLGASARREMLWVVVVTLQAGYGDILCIWYNGLTLGTK